MTPMVEATGNATTGSSGHTHGEYRETYQRGETDTSADTPRVLRFYTLVLRLRAVTLTTSQGNRDTHTKRREESALAQVLFNM